MASTTPPLAAKVALGLATSPLASVVTVGGVPSMPLVPSTAGDHKRERGVRREPAGAEVDVVRTAR